MMNADLVARSLMIGCQAVDFVSGAVLVAASVVVIARIVASATSALMECGRVVMNALDAMAEKSHRRIRAVALFFLYVVMLCCCGVLLAAASKPAGPAVLITPSTIVPKYVLDSVVVASMVGFAAYTVAELFVLVASGIVLAVVTVTTKVVNAARSVLSTAAEIVSLPSKKSSVSSGKFQVVRRATRAGSVKSKNTSMKSAMTSSSTPEKKQKKSLTFGAVQIREYSLTLGDHPCCKSYPLSLDWGHTKTKKYDLDLLEQAKSSAEPRPDLTPEQRLARIALVTGFCPELVEKKERRRVRKLQAAEKLDALANMDLYPQVSGRRRSGRSAGGYHEV